MSDLRAGTTSVVALDWVDSIITGFFLAAARQAKASRVPSRNAITSPPPRRSVPQKSSGRSTLFFTIVPVKLVLQSRSA